MSQLPTPHAATTPETAPFWEAAAEGRLRLPQCDDCGEVIWYPRGFCPSCSSRSVTWIDASGNGTVYSFTVVERGQGRWARHAPYVLAYVELDEGPRVLTNIYGDPDAVSVGSAVTARFDLPPEPESGADDVGGDAPDPSAVLRFDLA